MSRHLDVRPQADRDLVDIAEHLAAQNIDLGIRFLESFRRDTEFLKANPNAGPEYPLPHPRLTGIRKWSIRDFRNYIIFYRVMTDAIQVLRVVHGARDLPSLLESETP